MSEDKSFLNSKDKASNEDKILLEQVKNGNNEALETLINKYKDLVNMKVGKYFIIGAEKEDIYQEGMIGLYKAIKSFDTEKQNSFKTFANMCVERQLITAVKNSNRQKHIPLNSSVSLNSAAYEDNEDMDKMDVLDIKMMNDPSDIIADREYFENMESKIKENLSSFELQVLKEYEKGKSYAAIAEKLNAKVKSVDTAIQRIRKKANKIKENI